MCSRGRPRRIRAVSSPGQESGAGYPRRGEVWFADLDPVQGHEQAGRRPVLIVSDDRFNAGSSNLVVALPLTSRIRPSPSRVPVTPPEGGLKVHSEILCQQIRTLTQARLLRRWGAVEPATLAQVELALRVLLHL